MEDDIAKEKEDNRYFIDGNPYLKHIIEGLG